MKDEGGAESYEGPRDKLLGRGPRALSDAELLAVLLRTGRVGESATVLAGRLLACRDGTCSSRSPAWGRQKYRCCWRRWSWGGAVQSSPCARAT